MRIPVLPAGLVSQQVISEEIGKIHADAAASRTQPRLDFPPYRSTTLRHPARDPRCVDPEGAELFAPVFGHGDVGALESDLTIAGAGEPIGERIVVRGRVLDSSGQPVRRQLVEIWQANAAGRYAHQRDQHPAPLDPNFTGTGRCLTDDAGWRSGPGPSSSST
jgi:protocatechuate 3,4-dioxygenase beta subunit